MLTLPKFNHTNKLLIFFCCIIFLGSNFAFAQTQGQKKNSKADKAAQEAEDKLTGVQKESRAYRLEGFAYQNAGDLAKALSFYQKAVEIDPSYSVVYNDLGIVYEAMGQADRAESAYLKAVKIDPAYASVYSNLAILYETKRDLPKAALCWEKRAKLGQPDDPWTDKAWKRLNDIRMILGQRTTDDREEEVLNLMKDVTVKKEIAKTDNKSLAKQHFERAKLNYKKGDNMLAYKEAIDSKSLDPSNSEVDEFLEKLQTRLLSK